MALPIEMGGENDCKTPEEFLDKLSPRHEFWNPASPWIFRGQPGDFPLIPKAYRERGQAYRDIGIKCSDEPGATEYHLAHKQLISSFRLFLDETGLPIPTRVPEPYEHRIPRVRYLDEMSREAYPQLALAQHLGLPTPLLDWSTRAYVAAYFAVPKSRDPAYKGPHEQGERTIQVWALRKDFIGYREEEKQALKEAWMILETAPRSTNPNLHAQSGLFTLMLGEAAPTLTVNDYVAHVLATKDLKNEYIEMPIMRRLTLPTHCVFGLLKLLADEGIHGASMFPGYDGIVKAMKERALWNYPQLDYNRR